MSNIVRYESNQGRKNSKQSNSLGKSERQILPGSIMVISMQFHCDIISTIRFTVRLFQILIHYDSYSTHHKSTPVDKTLHFIGHFFHTEPISDKITVVWVVTRCPTSSGIKYQVTVWDAFL